MEKKKKKKRREEGRRKRGGEEEWGRRVAQRDGRCPIPGNIQGHVGQGSEQPDPGEDVPAHCRGVGLGGL